MIRCKLAVRAAQHPRQVRCGIVSPALHCLEAEPCFTCQAGWRERLTPSSAALEGTSVRSSVPPEPRSIAGGSYCPQGAPALFEKPYGAAAPGSRTPRVTVLEPLGPEREGDLSSLPLLSLLPRHSAGMRLREAVCLIPPRLTEHASLPPLLSRDLCEPAYTLKWRT